MDFGIFSRFARRERREYARQSVHFDVMYGRGEELTLTTAIDMSETGVSFLSRSTIPEGTQLNMRLMIVPGNQEAAIKLTSRVLRSSDKCTAVLFQDMKRSDRQRIHQYMAQVQMATELVNA